jgi:hypothetical protein
MDNFSVKRVTTVSVPRSFEKIIQDFYTFLDENRLIDDVGYILDAIAEGEARVVCDKRYGEININYVDDREVKDEY